MSAVSLQATGTTGGWDSIGLPQHIEAGGTQAIGQVLRAADEHGDLHSDDVLGGAGGVVCGTDPTLHAAVCAQAILHLDINDAAGQGLRRGFGCLEPGILGHGQDRGAAACWVLRNGEALEEKVLRTEVVEVGVG